MLMWLSVHFPRICVQLTTLVSKRIMKKCSSSTGWFINVILVCHPVFQCVQYLIDAPQKTAEKLIIDLAYGDTNENVLNLIHLYRYVVNMVAFTGIVDLIFT